MTKNNDFLYRSKALLVITWLMMVAFRILTVVGDFKETNDLIKRADEVFAIGDQQSPQANINNNNNNNNETILDLFHANNPENSSESDSNSYDNNSSLLDEFYPHNYFHRALRGDFPISQQISAMTILPEYIQQHSHHQLHHEWTTGDPHLHHRRFMVGYYSCPIEVGNRMHRFLNALLLAIASNRTLLWVYYDQSICLQDDAPHNLVPPERCHQELDNHVTDNTSATACDAILHRHSWIPSFSTWQHRLDLPPHRGVLIEQFGDGFGHTYNGPYDLFNTTTALRVVRIGRQVNGKLLYRLQHKHPEETARIVANPIRQRRFHRFLLSANEHFLYGMLFESCFTFRDYLLPPPSTSSHNHNHTLTFYLHSRHPLPRQNGTDIRGEIKCLQKLLPQNNRQPCLLYAMSDRDITLQLISQYVTSRFPNCRTLIPPHTLFRSSAAPSNATASSSSPSEHGVYRGVGFFQDWAWIRQARDGGIVYHPRKRLVMRTSSALLHGSVVFRRQVENRSGSDFVLCEG